MKRNLAGEGVTESGMYVVINRMCSRVEHPEHAEYRTMGKCRDNKRKPKRQGKVVTVGKAESVPPGRGATVKLKDGTEIALYNIGGTFHAIENFCPHKGYPLADSRLYGHIVECNLHAWRFDVRTGECFTKKSCSIESYDVAVEDGWIRLIV